MPFSEKLLERIASLPRRPGVYLMRGHDGDLLYIGKATDLRSRVRSYLGDTDPRPFVRLLDTLLADVEFIVTSTPKEALLLENTLIKRHRPRYNFELRDDKNYVSLRIDPDHPWPRVDVVRRVQSDGARYFGPFHSAAKVRQTLHVLNRHFQLRTCRDAVLFNRVRPCLQYQIQRCPAPCVLPIDREAYLDNVRHAMLFLSGRTQELIRILRSRMTEASERLEYEQAARYRDQIAAIQDSLETQHTVSSDFTDRDAIGYAREGEDIQLAVARYREGALVDVEHFALQAQVVDDDAVLASFLTQYGLRPALSPASEWLLPHPIGETEALVELLQERHGQRIRITVPQRGPKTELLALATENARNALAQRRASGALARRVLDDLARLLDLAGPPERIECYDISNFQGDQIVASRVVFRDAQPDRNRWRRYRLRTVDTQDDFASLREVALRRAAQHRKGEDPLPDLIVIDGGKGQLAAFLDGLRAGHVEPPATVALAKARALRQSTDSPPERSHERLFRPGVREPILLRPNTDVRHLLERLRDETHRFAIGFHRKERRAGTLRSGLDAIRGVGPQRRNALLRHFGSLKRVREASLPELEAVPGFNRHLAHAVHEHFHPGEADPPADDT